MLALFLSMPAFSQAPSDWILDKVNPVLEPDTTGALPWMANSVSSPSVIYDPLRDRLIMVFETRIMNPVDGAAVGCPQGLWGLGMAESPDGVTWTVRKKALIAPTPGNGSYFSCVAAHPTALWEQPVGGVDGGMVVWWKAEQDTGVLATCGTPTEPSWGCEQYTGVGRTSVTFSATGSIASMRSSKTPVIPASTFPSVGYPKVFRKGGVYTMLLSFFPDIYAATSLTHDGWGVPSPVMEVADYQGAISWVRDEFFNPADLCDDSITFPLAAFPGGRITGPFGVVQSGGWGKAISSTGTSWVLGVDAQQEWTGDDEFRHWDILRLVTGDYLIWFDQSDTGTSPKVNRIYFGGTTTTFNNTDLQSKTCL